MVSGYLVSKKDLDRVLRVVREELKYWVNVRVGSKEFAVRDLVSSDVLEAYLNSCISSRFIPWVVVGGGS